MPALTRAELLAAARAFCDSFAQKKSVDEILSYFAETGGGGDGGEGGGGGGEVVVHEHGLPQLAPFLGRDFRGLDGARGYFETVGECLRYEDMRFVEFVVDAGGSRDENGGGDKEDGTGKVAVRGKARFTWNETNQSWDETFVYVLLFDERGKLVRYEVWADSGAAYLARRGELGGEG
ncbi:transcription elongation factor S-II [Xylaria castorea]|nr:transcription elongation factor S-II [Xylaria castorea]